MQLRYYQANAYWSGINNGVKSVNDDFGQLADYVKSVTGLTLAPGKWQAEQKLPIFLRKLYHFASALLFGQPYLFAWSVDELPELKTLRKHLETLSQAADGSPVILVLDAITRQQRFILIRANIEFIVVNNQMFIPTLALDLRESFIARRNMKEIVHFSPAAQAILIRLLNDERVDLTQVHIPAIVRNNPEQLPYSAMTVTRACREMVQAGVLKISSSGRAKRTQLLQTSRDQLWNKIQPLLRSPVMTVLKLPLTADVQPLLSMARKAGETALSETGMLNPPSIPVWAVDKSLRNTLMHKKLADDVIATAEYVHIECWSYSPALGMNPESVDPFSLILSLQDVQDERVQIETEQLMEKLIK